MRHAKPNLDETLRRSYETLSKRWASQNEPMLHYRVSMECDEKSFVEALNAAISRKVSSLNATYMHAECPQVVLEFDCTYGVWRSLMVSFKGIPAVSRNYRQYEMSHKEGSR